MCGNFIKACKRSLKVNEGKSKVMVLNGGEGLECEVHVDGIQLEHLNTWYVFWMN